MKPTKKQKKSIRIEESLRAFNFESGKHLVTLKKVIYDDGSYSFTTREESIPFFASSKFQDKLQLFCKQYQGLFSDMKDKDSQVTLTKSLSKLLKNLQDEYNARGKDQVNGIEEWSSHAYGFDFSLLKAAKKRSKKSKKDKLVQDQKAESKDKLVQDQKAVKE